VEADRLKKMLGLSRVSFHDVAHPIAITDVPLEDGMQSTSNHDVVVDNFSFSPATAAVAASTSARFIRE
jgi:hypothetical protein